MEYVSVHDDDDGNDDDDVKKKKHRDLIKDY